MPILSATSSHQHSLLRPLSYFRTLLGYPKPVSHTTRQDSPSAQRRQHTDIQEREHFIRRSVCTEPIGGCIWFLFNDEVPYPILLQDLAIEVEELKAKLSPKASSLFHIRLSLGALSIDEWSLKNLIHQIEERLNLPVHGVRCAENTMQYLLSRRLGFDVEREQSLNREIIDASMRSGASHRSSGSVILYGDLHFGAKIEARGSVTILGRVCGFVHAGCEGDTSCRIISPRIDSAQLFVANQPAERRILRGSFSIACLQESWDNQK